MCSNTAGSVCLSVTGGADIYDKMPLPEKFPRDGGNCARETLRYAPGKRVNVPRLLDQRPIAPIRITISVRSIDSIQISPDVPDAQMRRSSPITPSMTTTKVASGRVARQKLQKERVSLRELRKLRQRRNSGRVRRDVTLRLRIRRKRLAVIDRRERIFDDVEKSERDK